MFQIMAAPLQAPDIHDVQLEVEIAAGHQVQRPTSTTFYLAPALTINPQLSAVITSEPDLAATALSCLEAAKAAGTVKAYSMVTRSFHAFCTETNQPFPFFTAESVTRFILRHAARKTGFAFIARIKPALSYLEKSLGRPTVFTDTIALLLAGAKRQARARAGSVKKAPPLSPKKLAAVINKIFPMDDDIGLENPIHMRTAFHMLLEYHTLCRYSCLTKLQGKHFEPVDGDIMITFPSAKNDQMHQGRISCLAATGTPLCPVRITHLFFRRFGLRMGAAEDDSSSICFQLRRERTRLFPILHKVLSSTQASINVKQLLAHCGFPTPKATHKTPKMTGVTAAFDGDATEVEVAQIGRWDTTSIPLCCKLNSFAYKKKIALKVPSLTPAGN